MKKHFFLLISCITVFAYCNGQKLKSYTKCGAIIQFLNSQDVTDWFNRFKSVKTESDSLIILDLDHEMSECRIDKWRGFPISIVNKGELFDSVKRYNWNNVIGLRRNIYVFSIYKVNDKPISFLILNGTTNLFSRMMIKEKKKRFCLGKIENSVQ